MKRLFFPISTLLLATSALAQASGMQSPAYQECTALAASNPTQALAKAEAWLKIDAGVPAQHCRAMALFGLHRFAEAGDALAAVRGSLPPENVTLRSYVTRQAAQSFLNINSADKALALLNAQIGEIGNVRADNANAAKQTSSLLLDRARLNITYGRLDEATKDLDHAVSLTPINEEVLIERAGVFEKLGDAPLARNDLDAVLTINPNNTKAKNVRARLMGKSQDATQPAPTSVQLPADAQLVAPMATAATAEATYTPGTAPTPKPTPQATTQAAAPVVDTAVTPVTSANLLAQAVPVSVPAQPAPVASPFTPPTVHVPQPAAQPHGHRTHKKSVKKSVLARATPAKAATITPAPVTPVAPITPLARSPLLPLPTPSQAP